MPSASTTGSFSDISTSDIVSNDPPRGTTITSSFRSTNSGSDLTIQIPRTLEGHLGVLIFEIPHYETSLQRDENDWLDEAELNIRVPADRNSRKYDNLQEAIDEVYFPVDEAARDSYKDDVEDELATIRELSIQPSSTAAAHTTISLDELKICAERDF
ncbi:hypothetical protein L202_00799 [Cryptococcus amylolentus CBS 6039]|uniref:Uncharacterized protein n=2 Tax=Cryptococcus amylolentus TaxID=104669 RepID=A0A1E3I989_9TREE|nr:hypothetical protein L202_00799 [Cryptococcus amylolentus CBS 6039]ODN84955.1 hypothetical protein L202_00799 [Cryptococcus amylolentus CBS 6039]ODO11347.1 hypothetical protein I350_00126 [Cryptococcus amylolentus CBS 6273]